MPCSTVKIKKKQQQTNSHTRAHTHTKKNYDNAPGTVMSLAGKRYAKTTLSSLRVFRGEGEVCRGSQRRICEVPSERLKRWVGQVKGI